jgi:midasin (ATPase involved in ribosome maturation)
MLDILQLTELERLIPTLPHQYHRLILVVGRHGTGKTRLLKELCRRADGAIPYLNLNLALSQRLLDLTGKERPSGNSSGISWRRGRCRIR